MTRYCFFPKDRESFDRLDEETSGILKTKLFFKFICLALLYAINAMSLSYWRAQHLKGKIAELEVEKEEEEETKESLARLCLNLQTKIIFELSAREPKVRENPSQCEQEDNLEEALASLPHDIQVDLPQEVQETSTIGVPLVVQDGTEQA
ncbi:hypothetical protein JCGZ_03549 [Jatropha curcas]|uniref:Uncharacterized protein n=1 Tax=Jatropha curcas TaxID=180498 RepID=A0A067KXX9_JATCU|nr:hypothetical protein JCGZ_03549 [Jatropha curcas]